MDATDLESRFGTDEHQLEVSVATVDTTNLQQIGWTETKVQGYCSCGEQWEWTQAVTPGTQDIIRDRMLLLLGIAFGQHLEHHEIANMMVQTEWKKGLKHRDRY